MADITNTQTEDRVERVQTEPTRGAASTSRRAWTSARPTAS
jgi:hypothetical protein